MGLMGTPFEVADSAQQGGLMLRKIWFPCGARNPHVMHKIQQGVFGAVGEVSERVPRVSDSMKKRKPNKAFSPQREKTAISPTMSRCSKLRVVMVFIE